MKNPENVGVSVGAPKETDLSFSGFEKHRRQELKREKKQAVFVLEQALGAVNDLHRRDNRQLRVHQSISRQRKKLEKRLKRAKRLYPGRVDSLESAIQQLDNRRKDIGFALDENQLQIREARLVEESAWDGLNAAVVRLTNFKKGTPEERWCNLQDEYLEWLKERVEELKSVKGLTATDQPDAVSRA